MTDKKPVSREEALTAADNIRGLVRLHVIRMAIGPRNADRTLENVQTIEDYIYRSEES